MGLFGAAEWISSDEPYIVRVFITNGPVIDKYSTLQYGKEGELYHISCKSSAHSDAHTYRVEGLRYKNIHYPAHRIEKIDVIRGEWVLIEVG
jgi:hypothetical protein